MSENPSADELVASNNERYVFMAVICENIKLDIKYMKGEVYIKASL